MLCITISFLPARPLLDWPSVLQVDKQNAAEHHKKPVGWNASWLII